MAHSIGDIARALGAEAFGNKELVVSGVSEPADASAKDLALALKPAFADTLKKGQARAAMLWAGADWESYGLEAAILAPRARFAMSGLSKLFDPGQGYAQGIHPSAIIHPDAEIGENITIGAMSVVEAGASIGANSVIGPQCYIGTDATIGADAFLYDNVTIAARVTIGRAFWCQPGARIGGDGFSFVTPEKSAVEEARENVGQATEAQAQSWARIHSLGSVSIGDNVEIGANTCIDRGTIRDTRIGDGTKIDNLVQIGHNVIVGEDCLLCAMTGVAGSTQIGNNVVLGGQTGVGDNLIVGDRVITGAGTMILSNAPAGRFMLGYPATKMETQVEAYKGLRRLPRLMKEVAALKKAVSNLGAKH
jgi:UDP-3-O-[3-hydroxymyristoyl] glucosamine N-acyltransferase